MIVRKTGSGRQRWFPAKPESRRPNTLGQLLETASTLRSCREIWADACRRTVGSPDFLDPLTFANLGVCLRNIAGAHAKTVSLAQRVDTGRSSHPARGPAICCGCRCACSIRSLSVALPALSTLLWMRVGSRRRKLLASRDAAGDLRAYIMDSSPQLGSVQSRLRSLCRNRNWVGVDSTRPAAPAAPLGAMGQCPSRTGPRMCSGRNRSTVEVSHSLDRGRTSSRCWSRCWPAKTYDQVRDCGTGPRRAVCQYSGVARVSLDGTSRFACRAFGIFW